MIVIKACISIRYMSKYKKVCKTAIRRFQSLYSKGGVETKIEIEII
jgi:hypothetical protein